MKKTLITLAIIIITALGVTTPVFATEGCEDGHVPTIMLASAARYTIDPSDGSKELIACFVSTVQWDRCDGSSYGCEWEGHVFHYNGLEYTADAYMYINCEDSPCESLHGYDKNCYSFTFNARSRPLDANTTAQISWKPQEDCSYDPTPPIPVCEILEYTDDPSACIGGNPFEQEGWERIVEEGDGGHWVTFTSPPLKYVLSSKSVYAFLKRQQDAEKVSLYYAAANPLDGDPTNYDIKIAVSHGSQDAVFEMERGINTYTGYQIDVTRELVAKVFYPDTVSDHIISFGVIDDSGTLQLSPQLHTSGEVTRFEHSTASYSTVERVEEELEEEGETIELDPSVIKYLIDAEDDSDQDDDDGDETTSDETDQADTNGNNDEDNDEDGISLPNPSHPSTPDVVDTNTDDVATSAACSLAPHAAANTGSLSFFLLIGLMTVLTMARKKRP